jgi:protein-tyrosine phosphatase
MTTDRPPVRWGLLGTGDITRKLIAGAAATPTAQIVAVICFVLCPLRFTFARPETHGVPGFLFAVLAGFDKPFNQAPSLHMSLLLILWTRYARHGRGLWQPLLHVWFTLMGLSVLFVYQHHVIDLWTGLIVGIVCLYAFPDAPRRWQGFAFTSDPQRRRLGFRYLTGALSCLTFALYFRFWAWWLLWPAAALSLVATAYFGAGTSVFQKADGRQSWPARILLAPYLLGAWISYRLYTRAAPALHEVLPGLYFGRWPRGDDLASCRPLAVLDLTAEFSAPRIAKLGNYGNVPILDLTTPEPPALQSAVEFIDKYIQQGPVYVHCALGFSRSATVVAAWLVRSKRFATPEEAMGHLAAQRCGVTWSPAHITAITEAVKITDTP